jgi:hypothetical protein
MRASSQEGIEHVVKKKKRRHSAINLERESK